MTKIFKWVIMIKEVRRMKKDGVILFVVGVLFGGLWVWVFLPEPPQVLTFNKYVERLAEERGIPVIEVKKLEVKEVIDEGVGSNVIVGSNVVIVVGPTPLKSNYKEQFIELSGKEAKIFVVNNEELKDKVIRKYWALLPDNYVIEYAETYNSPRWDFKVKEITKEGVVFGKDDELPVTIAILITLVGLSIYKIRFGT